MTLAERNLGVRRVYDRNVADDGTVTLRLADRIVELGAAEAARYDELTALLTAADDVVRERGDNVGREVVAPFVDAGILYDRRALPPALTGVELHRDWFAQLLPSWLDQAFSHPYWARMLDGRGSTRLFAGWLFELYHYTKNANRHMPLSCAHTRDKALKLLRAKHYAEEWNHYHYFVRSLGALGYDETAVSSSVPLPMTLALSNFMRQAAREDVLAYSICSAVLEGTTVERGSYNSYYTRCAELYGIPEAAIRPIYAHLQLDVQYGHSDLFFEICHEVDSLPAARAARVLEYGHQLVEHIWQWTDNIERYYQDETQPMPRRAFDLGLD